MTFSDDSARVRRPPSSRALTRFVTGAAISVSTARRYGPVLSGILGNSTRRADSGLGKVFAKTVG